MLKGHEFAGVVRPVCAELPPVVPHATLKHRRILAAGALGGEAMFATLGFIAHGLRMRGAEVTFLQCDRTLPACIAKIADHHESACTRWCHVNSAPFAAAMNLPCRWYGEFLTEAERKECDAAAARIDSAEIGKFRWRGVAVGPLVQLSVRRYFQRGDLELTDPEITPKARDYLRSALYLGHIADRALDELRIDKVVMTDGAYVDWGVIREVARLKGIPVDFFEDGLRGHSLRFYADRPGSTADPITAWRQHRDTSLSDTENRHLDDYLTERFSSPFEVYSTSLKATPSRSPANHRIGLPEQYDGLVFGMFPNVGFDAYFGSGTSAYAKPADWIFDTIEFFLNRPRHRLVIRAHPYEAWAKRPAQDRVDRLVAERFGPLPEHIHLIPPESDLPAGRIIEAMDVGLAYTSTVVIEAAVRGKPCLLAGGGDHAGAGVAREVTAGEDYAGVLAAICDRGELPQVDVEHARRYAYHAFFRRNLPIHTFDLLDWDVTRINVRSLTELAPEQDRAMDIICEGILCDAPFEWAEEGKRNAAARTEPRP